MVKEVKVFEASDGKSFKTKQGAQNHEKKIEIKNALERLEMTEEEVAEGLQKTAVYNGTIRMLLKREPNWKKWYVNHIRQITKKILAEPNKKTVYVKEHSYWGNTTEEEIAVETGESFADPEKHCEGEETSYKVLKTEQVDEYTLKVFYDYKYTWEERMSMKLKAGQNLTEDEVRTMVFELEQVYEEEGDEGRWERYMTTVVDLLGDHYAIDWSRGLTESQENSFYEQPYRAKVEKKEVIITKTYITAIDEES